MANLLTEMFSYNSEIRSQAFNEFAEVKLPQESSNVKATLKEISIDNQPSSIPPVEEPRFIRNDMKGYNYGGDFSSYIAKTKIKTPMMSENIKKNVADMNDDGTVKLLNINFDDQKQLEEYIASLKADIKSSDLIFQDPTFTKFVGLSSKDLEYNLVDIKPDVYIDKITVPDTKIVYNPDSIRMISVEHIDFIEFYKDYEMKQNKINESIQQDVLVQLGDFVNTNDIPELKVTLNDFQEKDIPENIRVDINDYQPVEIKGKLIEICDYKSSDLKELRVDINDYTSTSLEILKIDLNDYNKDSFIEGAYRKDNNLKPFNESEKIDDYNKDNFIEGVYRKDNNLKAFNGLEKIDDYNKDNFLTNVYRRNNNLKLFKDYEKLPKSTTEFKLGKYREDFTLDGFDKFEKLPKGDQSAIIPGSLGNFPGWGKFNTYTRWNIYPDYIKGENSSLQNLLTPLQWDIQVNRSESYGFKRSEVKASEFKLREYTVRLPYIYEPYGKDMYNKFGNPIWYAERKDSNSLENLAERFKYYHDLKILKNPGKSTSARSINADIYDVGENGTTFWDMLQGITGVDTLGAWTETATRSLSLANHIMKISSDPQSIKIIPEYLLSIPIWLAYSSIPRPYTTIGLPQQPYIDASLKGDLKSFGQEEENDTEERSYLYSEENRTLTADEKAFAFTGRASVDRLRTPAGKTVTFGTEMYWNIFFSYPEGNEKILPRMPYQGWIPVKSYNLQSFRSGTKSQQTMAGNITYLDMYELPTTISMDIPETCFMDVDHWLRSYFACIYGSDEAGAVAAKDNRKIKILPYKKQCMYIKIAWYTPHWDVIRTKKFICIPNFEFSYKGVESADIKTIELTFSIVGTDSLEKIPVQFAQGFKKIGEETWEDYGIDEYKKYTGYVTEKGEREWVPGYKLVKRTHKKDIMGKTDKDYIMRG